MYFLASNKAPFTNEFLCKYVVFFSFIFVWVIEVLSCQTKSQKIWSYPQCPLMYPGAHQMMVITSEMEITESGALLSFITLSSTWHYMGRTLLASLFKRCSQCLEHCKESLSWWRWAGRGKPRELIWVFLSSQKEMWQSLVSLWQQANRADKWHTSLAS